MRTPKSGRRLGCLNLPAERLSLSVRVADSLLAVLRTAQRLYRVARLSTHMVADGNQKVTLVALAFEAGAEHESEASIDGCRGAAGIGQGCGGAALHLRQ